MSVPSDSAPRPPLWEAALRRLPGVLGAVALPGPQAEIQLFVVEGADLAAIRDGAHRELADHGQAGARVLVFEMLVEPGEEELPPQAAPAPAEPEAGEEPSPAAPPALGNGHRPRIARVELVTRERRMLAHVELRHRERELPGDATSQASPYGLDVTATATAEAVAALLDAPAVDLTVEDAVLIEVAGRLAVAVLVQWGDGQLLLGTSLANDRPLHEAAARATLDAINRRLAHHFRAANG